MAYYTNKRMPGIDPDKFDKMLALLREGHTRKDAARLSGISSQTLKSWEVGAADGVEYCIKMVEHMECSEANIVHDALQAVKKAADQGQWKAAAFLLESKRPEQFGRRDQKGPAPQAPAMNVTPTLTNEQSKEKLFQMAMKLCAEDPKYRVKLLDQVKLLSA